jgi:hypothetical protein
MVVAETFAGLGIFKSLYDSAKALKDINDATVRNGAVIELQEKILIARETQTALLDRVGELEKEVTGFKTWEREKDRYALKDASGRGEFAYIIKKSEQRGEPVHAICARCYQQDKKSILQWSGKGFDSEVHWRCLICDNVITLFEPIVPV